LYEVEDNAAAIWRALGNNPRYLERCRYPENHLLSERKLQQFNRVMNWAGLWGEAKRIVVRDNLDTEAIDAPRRLAIDPGHQDAGGLPGPGVQGARQQADGQGRTGRTGLSGGGWRTVEPGRVTHR
jgi:hypothetical protein